MTQGQMRGRKSICKDGGKATRDCFKICPDVKAQLIIYCKENKELRSRVLNEAISEYLQKRMGSGKI